MNETSNVTNDRPPIAERIGRLLGAFQEDWIDALLVGTESNRRYLSGFTGSAGNLILTPERRLLVTDGRYTSQATAQSPDYEVVIHSGELLEEVAARVGETGIKRLGFDPGTTTVSDHQSLIELLGEDVELVPAPGLVEQLRMIKDEYEFAIMRRAIEMADRVHAMVARELVPGRAERDVAIQIEQEFRALGAQKPAFDVIVAAGPNSAMPHHLPGDYVINAGEPVVVDIGASLEGYCSDITRTYCPGGQTARFQEIYRIVLEAEEAAIAGVAGRKSGREVHELAHTVIAEAGYGDYFDHGVGHGVGMDIHEGPRLARTSTDTLEVGMIHSIEPGIYLPDWGGVRVEDLVLVSDDGAEVLTAAEK